MGLHWTQAEIDIWNTRKVSGPYKDGHDRIIANADAFKAAPGGSDPGFAGPGCAIWQAAPTFIADWIQDRDLRDAGFIYLLTGDTSYRDPVRDQLLDQIAETGTDFANETKFCRINGGPSSTVFPVGGGLREHLWCRRILYGYAYIRDSLTTQQKTDIDAWFDNAADFWMDYFDAIAERIFPNRATNQYDESDLAAGSCTALSDQGLLYFGAVDPGPTARGNGFAWDNFATSRLAFCAAAAIVTNNTGIKTRVKKGFEEWVKFMIYPAGASAIGALWDEKRWGPPPNTWLGFNYFALSLGSAITVADHFARAGDTSLYNFSTSDGVCGSEGGPKSILDAMTHLAGMTNGTILDYGSDVVTTDSDLVIDQETPDQNHQGFVYLAAGNTFFDNAAVKTAYTTTPPSSPWQGGYESISGDWGSYPDVRFMFGQMEGVVWPYPGGVIGQVGSSFMGSGLLLG